MGENIRLEGLGKNSKKFKDMNQLPSIGDRNQIFVKETQTAKMGAELGVFLLGRWIASIK